MALTLAGGVAGGATANLLSNAGEVRAATAQSIPVDTVPLSRLTLAPLVERVSPAVVRHQASGRWSRSSSTQIR
ncbi:hypothetical protein OF829_01935 [Sphingomonas sp. LB-2]|uniref:hypothetical protein n=1 Tax=Sphingomonas caeni TaxID=2984949 RepID=UPI00222F2161|nr:hypothetical protein [Sphingomonas caeni]MCW3845983.1 hypothetical protein [Sphingomonas caeni]